MPEIPDVPGPRRLPPRPAAAKRTRPPLPPPPPRTPARWEWELTPRTSVGPLDFGMRFADVVHALPDMPEPRLFPAADPRFPALLGVEFGTAPQAPTLRAYFDDDQLLCVAVDAARGPQVTLFGRELTGCVPADLERFLTLAHAHEVIDLTYGPHATPASPTLGLVLRTQHTTPGTLRTRPVMVSATWPTHPTADPTTLIPTPEWPGPPWPSPEDRLPPPRARG